MTGPKRRAALLVRLAGGALLIALLLWTFRDVDPTRVRALLAQVGGPALLLVLLPQLTSLACECVGWRAAFRVWGRKVAYFPLLRIRLMTEALAQTLPMGVVFAESVKPPLLERMAGVALSDGVAAVAARKYLLLLAHSSYVLVIAWLGRGTLRQASIHFFHRPGLERVMLGAGVLIALLAFSLAGVVGHGRLATRALGLLRRVPLARLQAALSRWGSGFRAADGAAERFFRAGGPGTVWPALPMLGGWLCESLESYLIVSLLGVQLDFVTVASVEITLSLLRNIAVAVPAGLGIQDAGYVAFFAALGVPDPVSVGAAFALIKRSKELFWAVTGYGLWAIEMRQLPAAKRGIGSAWGMDTP